MAYQLIFRKNAENHLLEIHEWYEKQRTGLGDEFFLSVEASISAVKENPFLFQLKFKNVRCATTPRFPYGIY
jgi:hypothetical protein